MALVPRAPTAEYDTPDWLSPGEVARMLNVHVETIYRHLARGTLNVDARKIGRVWRIRRTDVETTGAAALVEGHQ